MGIITLLKPDQKPIVIAALRLPSFTFFQNFNARSLPKLIDFAIRNTEVAIQGKVDAVYLQDMDNYPISSHIDPYSVAMMTAIGREGTARIPAHQPGVKPGRPWSARAAGNCACHRGPICPH